jgi:hypothetical protein
MKDIRFKSRVHWASTYQEVMLAIKMFVEGTNCSKFWVEFNKKAMLKSFDNSSRDNEYSISASSYSTRPISAHLLI